VLHRRDGARFTPGVTLGIQANGSILVSSDQNLVSHCLSVLLANSKMAVMCLLLRSGFRLATPSVWLPPGLIGGVLQRRLATLP
jgi:hypothetical protein